MIRIPGDTDREHVEVRRGPGPRFAVVDRLRRGDLVLLCDWSEAEGGWSGVVYGEEEGTDCGGLGSPIAERQPYRGPCRSGWIPTESMEVIAG